MYLYELFLNHHHHHHDGQDVSTVAALRLACGGFLLLRRDVVLSAAATTSDRAAAPPGSSSFQQPVLLVRAPCRTASTHNERGCCYKKSDTSSCIQTSRQGPGVHHGGSDCTTGQQQPQDVSTCTLNHSLLYGMPLAS